MKPGRTQLWRTPITERQQSRVNFSRAALAALYRKWPGSSVIPAIEQMLTTLLFSLLRKTCSVSNSDSIWNWVYCTWLTGASMRPHRVSTGSRASTPPTPWRFLNGPRQVFFWVRLIARNGFVRPGSRRIRRHAHLLKPTHYFRIFRFASNSVQGR